MKDKLILEKDLLIERIRLLSEGLHCEREVIEFFRKLPNPVKIGVLKKKERDLDIRFALKLAEKHNRELVIFPQYSIDDDREVELEEKDLRLDPNMENHLYLDKIFMDSVIWDFPFRKLGFPIWKPDNFLYCKLL